MTKINPWTFQSQSITQPAVTQFNQQPASIAGGAQDRVGGSTNPYNLQGASQDALVSFSPEALEELGQQQAAPAGANLGQQLEEQIQTGDLQSALATAEQMEQNAPGDGMPAQVKSLHEQLISQLEAGDQEGAEETLTQIQAQRPSGPPPAQQ